MAKMFSFFEWIEKLKHVRRRISGAGDKDKYESIADHCFKMAFWGWALAKGRKDLDWQKVIRMELIHDLAKAPVDDGGPHGGLFSEGRNRTGDLVKKWPDGIDLAKKREIMEEWRKVEEARVRQIVADLPPDLRDEILSLWLEYMRGVSAEARFANQIGALDNLMQAVDCLKDDPDFDVEPWIFYARKTVDDPELLKYLDEAEGRMGRKRSGA